MNYGKEFTKGILKENPTLVGLLGMCPTLAVTTAAFNGIGMGLSTMFVLICSNIVISLLRKVIPEQVKLPCYIVIIASFVTVPAWDWASHWLCSSWAACGRSSAAAHGSD